MKREQLTEFTALTLTNIDLYSKEAVQMLICTAAHESDMGQFIRQYPTGPARGVFQMEGNTFEDIKDNYLRYNPSLMKKIIDECNVQRLVPSALEYNLKVQVCFARVHYLRVPEKLPAVGDFEGVARYWKKYYNTHLGKGTEQGFLESLKKHKIYAGK